LVSEEGLCSTELVRINNDVANVYYSDLIQKFSYLVYIFEKLGNLNKSMQGPQMNILTQNDNDNANVLITLQR